MFETTWISLGRADFGLVISIELILDLTLEISYTA